jgi:hypothetical protein
LIEEEVNRMFNAKISTISLSISKSFLVKHLFNDSRDNSGEVLKGHWLEQIQDKFIVLSSSNVHNLVFCSSNVQVEVTLTTSLSLSPRVITISFRKHVSQLNIYSKYLFFLDVYQWCWERSWVYCTNAT